MPHIISKEVSMILSRSSVYDDRIVLPEALDRPSYMAVNKAIELLGGQWSRKERAHLFHKRDALTRLAEVTDGFQLVDRKKDFDYFPTPVWIAERLVEWCEIGPDSSVLEPSAGGGRLVEACVRRGALKQLIFAAEIQPDLFDELLLAGYAMFGRDFMEIKSPRMATITRIAMNPPFSAGQDIDHILHALKFLAPGGILCAITSPSWTFNSQKKFVAFRNQFEDWMEHNLAWKQALPEGSFKESGTNISTLMIKIRKPA